MSTKREPNSTRVKRDSETVLARHRLILSLWRQGLTQQECAEVAGLSHAYDAHYHISGKCRCEL